MNATGPTEIWDEVHLWYQIFRDLSDIQRARRVRLEFPNDGITAEEIQTIANAAAFIRGEIRITGEVRAQVFAQRPEAPVFLTREPIDHDFPYPVHNETFLVLGVPITIHYIIGVRKAVPTNIEEALAEAARGAETVTLIYDGTVGELYERYLPDPPQSADQEMTAP